MTVVGSPVTWRPRPLQIASWVGLGISTVALLAALPNLFTNGGGAGTDLGNAAASVWTLLLLFSPSHLCGRSASRPLPAIGFPDSLR